MRYDYINRPLFPEYVTYRPYQKGRASIVVGLLTIGQLKECREVCEAQLAYYHPDSPFVPLIRTDLREIDRAIRKKSK